MYVNKNNIPLRPYDCGEQRSSNPELRPERTLFALLNILVLLATLNSSGVSGMNVNEVGFGVCLHKNEK
ncbi:unnamed protein product [Schistosoma curassoni]|uniref:Uncharacterized protein n=1 Tax=Schistosoma curassoni TaxID=6186 RepID=A0A183KAL1_9TREM|nr:unnamed protein product [Schistosoma curassoni]